MKLSSLLSFLLSFFLVSALPTWADSDPLPNSGTYFIINASSDEALQPVGPTAGQNVLLYPFNKSGMQKWEINRRIDPATKKPTNKYTIKLAGESGLSFQPHPVADSSAIISLDPSVFVLEPGDGGLLIKSVQLNGDALYIFPYPPMNTETRFGPDDSSNKFRWKFVSAN